jgi:hypothetical protein
MPIRTPDDDSEGPASPEVPSFASLRNPRRRTAVDLLMPDAPPEPAITAPPAGGQRPAEWSDLLLLGRHVTRSLVGVPGRVAGWQLRVLRRVLGR